MTMEFTELTNDEQYHIIQQRLRNYETQFLNARQNLDAATTLKKASEIRQWTNAIQDLEVRCNTEREALSKLDKPAEDALPISGTPRQHRP